MKRHRRGASVVEMLVTVLVVALTLMAVFNLVVGAGRASASYELTSSLSRHSRTAIDEVLYQTRGGESILSSATLSGRTITTSSTCAVVRLPAYHPNYSTLFIDGSWDIVAFEYDASTRTLYETVQPANGSARPARNRYPIARNVSTAKFTYNARQSYRAVTLGVQAFALGAPLAVGVNAILGGAGTAAQVFVDGSPTEFNNVLGSNIITTNAPLGATVQIVFRCCSDSIVFPY
ncbi:MAG: hypothetical protein QM758_18955 [Armatimonas sp.]